MRRTRNTIFADLIDAPADFEVVPVGIDKLDRHLRARAAAAFEHNLRAMFAQMIARTKARAMLSGR